MTKAYFGCVVTVYISFLIKNYYHVPSVTVYVEVLNIWAASALAVR
jgi:hypothetical protein